MLHLGYPAYFSDILGAWKILGALAVAAPELRRAKEWAYAGMLFDLTGAAISRVVVGDGAAGAVPPLAIALLAVASWALRPERRMLRDAAGRRP
jgi:DoxX-like family